MKRILLILFFIIISFSISISYSGEWKIIETGLNNDLNAVTSLNESEIIITTNDGMFLKSTDLGATWDIIFTDMLFVPEIDFKDEDNGVAYSIKEKTLIPSQLFLTSDKGESWEMFKDIPLTIPIELKYTENSQIVFMGIRVIPGSPVKYEVVFQKHILNGNLILDKIIADGLCGNGIIENNYIWVPTSNGELYLSTDDGESWNKNADFIFSLRHMKSFQNKLYVWGENKIYFSSDNGNSWQEQILNIDVQDKEIYQLYINSKGKIYVICKSSGITNIYTSSNWENWEIPFTAELDISKGIEIISDSLLLIPVKNGKILKGIINEPVSVVNWQEDNSTLSLHPNPTTDHIIINTDLLSGKLEIYNMLGIKVAEQSITSVREKIDVSGLQAGMYFLKAGDEVRKFVKR